MQKLIALVVLYCSVVVSVQASVVCARVDWLSHETGRDGVRRSATWQERICFDENTRWRERLNLMPAIKYAGHDAKHDSAHEHPDINIASQWLQKTDARTQAHLIFAAQKWRVTLTASEYDLIGFDGQWPSLAAWLGLPADLRSNARNDARMTAETMRTVADLRWQWQWPENEAFPRSFSAQRTQSQYELRATLHREAVTAEPWLVAQNYQMREWSDWSD